MKQDSSVAEIVLDMHRKLRVEVKIPNDEVDRLVVNRLISIRHAMIERKEDSSHVDKTIKFFLLDDEFEKYVICRHRIEY